MPLKANCMEMPPPLHGKPFASRWTILKTDMADWQGILSSFEHSRLY
jgi:hypothetical protein